MAIPSKKRLNITVKEKNILLKKYNINNIEDIDKAVIFKLKEDIKKLTDPRQQNKTSYKIWDIVICVFLAQLAGCSSWYEIEDFVKEHHKWIKSFLKLSGGIPSYQTYERIISLINRKELENILTNFYKSLVNFISDENDIISLDGKVSKSSSREKSEIKDKVNPLNVLNAYSTNHGICLASEVISEKTNEIPNIPVILDRFNVKNNIITWDALNTQKENVAYVIKKQGDFVVPVKGNHKIFLSELEQYFNEKQQEMIIAGNPKSSYLKYYEKVNSRVLTYEYFQTEDIKWFEELKDWKGTKSFGMVKKTIEYKGKVSIEYRYYISSLFLNIDLFSNAIRNHWGVENKLHWHLDFTFKDDYNTTENKNALINLQIINKFCLGILNKVKTRYQRSSLKRIKFRLSLNFSKNFVDLMCYLGLS